MRRITVYDSTLRDGTQAAGVALSVEDKIAIARRLDALGVDYIEGGWPGSNPKDKVRVINGDAATAARVRVLITSTDGRRYWGTVGVSENIVLASARALADSLEYALMSTAPQRAG